MGKPIIVEWIDADVDIALDPDANDDELTIQETVGIIYRTSDVYAYIRHNKCMTDMKGSIERSRIPWLLIKKAKLLEEKDVYET